MRIDEDGRRSPEAESATEDGEAEDREKVIVRSNGTVTYVGKDIAYQFWKFGLLGIDFQYRPFADAYGRRDHCGRRPATQPPRSNRIRRSARGTRTYNVIDVRQSYLQKLLKQALAAMGHTQEAERSIHFSYEMVALSHQTARELGYETSEEDAKKPFVEVSGRKGLGRESRRPDRPARTHCRGRGGQAQRRPAGGRGRHASAGRSRVAAVRYFMVKYSRGKVIAFDIAEALSFEGESGPYLQYAVVRANNIFSKMAERLSLSDDAVRAQVETLSPEALTSAEGDEAWGLILEAARLDEIVEQVVRTLEFSVLAKHAFSLAQGFNAFYHRAPILNEERDDVRLWRAAAVAYVRLQLTRALDLMGIDVPVRM